MDAVRAMSARTGNSAANRERPGGPAQPPPQDPVEQDGSWSWFAPSRPGLPGQPVHTTRPTAPAPAATPGSAAPPSPAHRTPTGAPARPRSNPLAGLRSASALRAAARRAGPPPEVSAHGAPLAPAPARHDAPPTAADSAPPPAPPVPWVPPVSQGSSVDPLFRGEPRADAAPAAPPAPAPAPPPARSADLTSVAQAPVPPPVPAPSRPLNARPTSEDAALIVRSMEAVAPFADKVVSYFYATLFLHNPHLRELFPAAMDHQRDRLFRALLIAAKHVDDQEFLTQYLSNLGRGHRKYGTRSEHYPAVGEALIAALSRYGDGVWDDETEAAWVRAYTTISQTMIDAAAADERVAPAWWEAEVVSLERRTRDIVVLTVRPDQPYPFQAGQYTTLETPWWPRVWRNYSFATAPRPDGLLTFHVKAIPAGWVSTALVHRSQPGDVLRLGPPAGSMVVDHSSAHGLLCLAGGTGIAPIEAIVEDVAAYGIRRRVEVYYGARCREDLYDLETMVRLERQHPWLSLHSVVDTPGEGQGTEPLTDLVRQHGPWQAFDAYLSGPPGLIRSGVDALTGIGIPSHRIRHDFVGDPVEADE